MHDEPMIDPLDREIADALAVDPSPTFVARVRQRVAAEPAPAAWRFPWIVMTTTALAAAAILAIVLSRDARRPIPPPPLLPARASAVLIPLPDVASGFSRIDDRMRAASPRRLLLRPPSEPEILIDAREAQAIRSLIRGARDGSIDLALVLRASTPGVMELPPVTAIEIPDITIEPIAPGTGDKGVQP
jgi:hypothetical protein